MVIAIVALSILLAVAVVVAAFSFSDLKFYRGLWDEAFTLASKRGIEADSLRSRAREAESALVRKCDELKDALDEIASLNEKLAEEQDASRALAAGLMDQEEQNFVQCCVIDDLAIAIKDARDELGDVLCDLGLCDCECGDCCCDCCCDCEAEDESIEDACCECDDCKADDSQGFTGCTAFGPPPSDN